MNLPYEIVAVDQTIGILDVATNTILLTSWDTGNDDYIEPKALNDICRLLNEAYTRGQKEIKNG